MPKIDSGLGTFLQNFRFWIQDKTRDHPSPPDKDTRDRLSWWGGSGIRGVRNQQGSPTMTMTMMGAQIFGAQATYIPLVETLWVSQTADIYGAQ